ncbi:hypothetical protein Krad_0456 [Kineococcus radiotolerans SRS30216 = ATCC BAA-149]|uniref:Uncharacterized protein n=1 Tax=Kineococcus radiotolerans (strain ATCC BAA-149 / DSM 14245 / SRS30216) TaxID=266940 RepID=A6W557_KINRD|nr:hypothetical protein Krad_0456 [Kineococcus radiotolerans SRS30216 = ATCC BAA-149]
MDEDDGGAGGGSGHAAPPVRGRGRVRGQAASGRPRTTAGTPSTEAGGWRRWAVPALVPGVVHDEDVRRAGGHEPGPERVRSTAASGVRDRGGSPRPRSGGVPSCPGTRRTPPSEPAQAFVDATENGQPGTGERGLNRVHTTVRSRAEQGDACSKNHPDHSSTRRGSTQRVGSSRARADFNLEVDHAVRDHER